MRRGNWGVALVSGLLCLAVSCRVLCGGEAESKAFIKIYSAAQKGDVEAQTKLGFIFLRGENAPVDYKAAMEWFGKAAEQGDAVALLNIGILYETGRGVEVSLDKAFVWYMKAALQGNAEAQSRVSWFYWMGRVMKQDKLEAWKWCSRAAEQGDVSATLRLGLCYREGIGSEKDEAKAFACFYKAAAQGNGEALARVSIGYFTGVGIRKDVVEAYKWALIAGPNWDDGGKMIRTLEREMSREQIETAQRLAGVYLRTKMLKMPLDTAMAWGIFDKGTASERMPFLRYDGAVVLPVTVGEAKFNLCVDTGADITCVDDGSAGKLALANLPILPGRGLGPKTEECRITSPVELKVPGLTVAPVQFWRLPMKGVMEQTDQPIHGFLGVDVLSRFVIEIDYEARTIQFFDPKSYRYEGKSKAVPVTYKERHHCVRVKLTLAQGDPVEFDCPIDTGASGDNCLILGRMFVENHEVLKRVGKLTPQAGIGVGGVHETFLTRVPSLEIGDQVIQSPLVELSASEKGVLATSEDGVIAAGFWKRFKVILDFPHERIYLEPNSHVKDAGRYNLCGFYPNPVKTSAGEWVVEKVFANTPASEAGLQKGDVVLELDGKKFDPRRKEDNGQLRAIDTPGDHEFLIRREGKELKIKMTFRDLL